MAELDAFSCAKAESLPAPRALLFPLLLSHRHFAPVLVIILHPLPLTEQAD